MLSEYRGKMIFTHPCQDNTVVRKKCQFTFDDSFKISLLIFLHHFTANVSTFCSRYVVAIPLSSVCDIGAPYILRS